MSYVRSKRNQINVECMSPLSGVTTLESKAPKVPYSQESRLSVPRKMKDSEKLHRLGYVQEANSRVRQVRYQVKPEEKPQVKPEEKLVQGGEGPKVLNVTPPLTAGLVHAAIASEDNPVVCTPSSDSRETILSVKISEDPDLKDLSDPKKSGRFKLQNKMIHLTYSYQFDEVAFLDHINEIMKSKNATVETYSIVKEFGKRKTEDGDPYPHTHAAFKFNKSVTITDSRFFDYKTKEIGKANPHPHIRGVGHIKHWNYLCDKYHTKQGTPYTNYQSTSSKDVSIEELQSCETPHHVTQLMASKNQILKTGPALKAWEHSHGPLIPSADTRLSNLREWQQLIIDTYQMDLLDKRTIFWIADQAGAAGKTSLSYHLKHFTNTFVTSTTNVKDALHSLTNHIHRDGYPKIVILDISRSVDAHAKGIYNFLEKIKDGTYTDGKYNSHNLTFPKPPMVLVFSNTYPDVNQLSYDRWLIMNLNWSGQKFDIAFEGSSAKRVVDRYEAIQRHQVQLASEIEEDYAPIIPFRQRLDVRRFQKAASLVDINVRRSYWDRAVIPFVNISLRIGCGFHDESKDDNYTVTIEEKPMTGLEFRDYQFWKMNPIDYCPRTIRDLADQIQRQEEQENDNRVAQKFRDALLEKKRLRDISV